MAATVASHLVLARKWRPEQFDDLVGQEHVTRTLVQALKSGRIAHAFLFAGIRGVGKTTAARILARCLDCAEGPTPQPCGSCAACREIRTGSCLDVVEIDGATYRKIDDARAIIENLGYRPARDRFKIYIIDEAHQLTDQAFNALLKTLEEPPPHVKFILATTEPQKMPETILSRLQRYDFRRIPFAIILARLRELAGREGAQIDASALALLAREASGSMRDAERMLETAIASLDGKVNEAELAVILGVASRTRIFEMIGAILDKDAARALSAVRELNQRGANLEGLGRDLLEMIRNLAVARLPGADASNALLADLPDQEIAELRRLASLASGRDLMRLFRLMADAQEQLTHSPFPDLMLEMAMIRMATLAPVLDSDELMSAIRASGRSGDGSTSSGGESSGGPALSGQTQTGSATMPKIRVAADPPSAMAASGAASNVIGGAVSLRESDRTTNRAIQDSPAVHGTRRIPLRGEVKAEAPPRPQSSDVMPNALDVAGSERPRAGTDITGAPSATSRPDNVSQTRENGMAAATVAAGGELPDLRDFIRSRRAALAGFMEQGASLHLDGDTLAVTPRSDIYIRYLADNRSVIGELASELYGRRIKIEMPAGVPSRAAEKPAAHTPEITAPVDGLRADASPGPRSIADKAAPPSIESTEGVSSPSAVSVHSTGVSQSGSGISAANAQNKADARQRLYSDPVVRRLFEEFDARLVDIKSGTVAKEPGGEREDK